MGLVMTTRLKNRHEGGRLLARLVADYAGGKDVGGLAIASGGVPVAAAHRLGVGLPNGRVGGADVERSAA